MIACGWIGLGRAGLWSVPVVGVIGCTILAPVQTPEDDRRFPLKLPATETVSCVDKPGNGKQCMVELKDDIDKFHGGLGRAMWEMDLRRRQLVAQAAERTNINSTYNALLWPLGAFLIAKKIHDPGWNTVDAAALGVATYGLLGSGIPDRDKLYLKTAARMACTMVEFDADLYPRDEIQPHGYRPQDGSRGKSRSVDGNTLAERLDDLESEMNQFREERDIVLTGIKLKKPKAGLTGKSVAEKARLDALGLSGSSKPPTDPTDAFQFETGKLLSEARALLSDGQKLKQRLDDAGARMRKQRSVIEGALTQGLNDRTPELVSPTARAKEITQAMEDHITAATAAAARLKKQSGGGRAEGWFPTAAELEGVEDEPARKLRYFWNWKRPDLKVSMGRLEKWKTRHDERVRAAKADAAAMACGDGSLGDFAALLRKVSETAAASGAAAAAAAAKASEPGK